MGARIAFRLLGLVICVLPFGLASGANGLDSWAGQECSSCHLPEPLFSHPVGVTPSFPIPRGFPLTDGRITCGTCHTDESREDHLEATRLHPSLLRNPQIAAVRFCMQCHLGNGRDPTTVHGMGTGRAHLQWSSGPDERASFDVGWGGERHRQAARAQDTCLSCHDGDIAGDAQTVSTGSGMRSGEHPVGVAYPLHADRGAKSRMTSISELDYRIRLFAGKIECRSCHSVFSKERNLLVVSNAGSNLCFSCHDM